MLGGLLLQITLLLVILTILAFLLGEYMAKVFAGERTFLSPILMPVENFFYAIMRIDPNEEMTWKTFVLHFLLFTTIGIVVLLLLQRLQNILPWNPENFQAIKWDSAINTAISFVTNTNWQSYNSESSLSYLTRMLGIGLQHFLSAAAGMSVGVALINAFVRRNTSTIGNFWVYLTRSIIYVLLPLSIILALFLISQGTPDNLKPYVHAQTLENKEQIIAQGPAASQIAIKNLGTNGGGFFAANAAHPYENPNPLTDYINILSLLLIAAAFPFTFGALMKDRAQGWTIFITMMLFFILGVGVALWAESQGNPLFTKLGIQHGLNLEGKEVRFGIISSAVFANGATATACGAANSAYSSLMPLTELVITLNVAIGEIVFGGVGAGFIGMMFYIMLTMFLVGLSIGRSPEVYGKKLDPYEIVMVSSALFLPCIVRFFFSAVAISIDPGIAGLGNPGFHGLSEALYAYASAIGNNGSSFASLKADTTFYNVSLAFSMLFGRLITILPALAIAGSLVQKNTGPKITRFPTATPLFVVVLVSVIVIVGALAFLPSLVLGPILEHLYLFSGKTF